MLRVVFLASLLVGVLGSPLESFDDLLSSGRIVNGTNAQLGEFPFIASLQTTAGRHFCGASIVNECTILTAAHCVVGDRPESVIVLVGAVSLSEGGVRHEVSQIIVHSRYNPSNMYIHDIAILKLTNRINFNADTEPTKLPAQLEVTAGGTPAVVIGWGIPYTGGSVMNDLQKVTIGVYSDADCQRIHYYTVHNSNICAGVPEGGKGQCSGDSGGPLVANGQQVGLVSWSVKPCTVAPYPGVYTEVAHYIDWIQERASCSNIS